MKILLIWEEVPETTVLYLFNTEGRFAISEEHERIILDAHNGYVNCNTPNEEAASLLFDILGDHKDKILNSERPVRVTDFGGEELTIVISGFIS